MENYRKLLSYRGVYRLIGANFLWRIYHSVGGLALVILIYQSYRSFALAGAATALAAYATAVSSPLQGRFSDRFGPRRVLMPLAGFHTLVLSLLLVAVESRWAAGAVVSLAALWGLSLPFLSSAMRSTWLKLVPNALHPTAFAFEAIISSIAYAIGPAFGSLLLLGSSLFAVIMAGALGLVGTWWFLTSPELSSAHAPHGLRQKAFPGGTNLILLLTISTFFT